MTENHSFGCIEDQIAMGLHDLSKAEVYHKPKEMTKEMKIRECVDDEDCLFDIEDLALRKVIEDVFTKKEKQITELKAQIKEKEMLLTSAKITAHNEGADKIALLKENAKLKAQIEKMKSDVVRCFGDEFNILVAKLLKEWEIKEK